MTSMGFYLALWARLIEIGIRITFCTLALMCTSLCKELSEQIDHMIENKQLNKDDFLYDDFKNKIGEFVIGNDNTTTKSREELQNRKDDYEKILNLIEIVNSSFGLVLFLFICHDFGLAIFKFYDAFRYEEKVERVCAFAHQFFRIMILLAVSNHVKQKERIYLL